MDYSAFIILVFILVCAAIIVLAIIITSRTRAEMTLPGNIRFYIEAERGWQPVPRSGPKKPPDRKKPSPKAGPRAPSRPRTRLVARVRGGRDWEYSLEGKDIIYIGRRSDNDIVLRDPAADTRQAVIYLEGGRYRINNLSATKPTKVNNRPITKQNLGDGNTIQMGNTKLIFRQEKRR